VRGNQLCVLAGCRYNGRNSRLTSIYLKQFINLIRTGKKKQQKDDIDLQPCTSEISVVEVEVDGVRVVIVDTPGIDDTRVSVKEADVLAIIAKHFGAT